MYCYLGNRLWHALLFLVAIFGCNPSPSYEKPTPKQKEIKKFLSALPSEEHFLLEFFFRCLIQEDAIGYVLLGGKPMSFYSYLKPKISINSFQVPPLDRMELFFLDLTTETPFFIRDCKSGKSMPIVFAAIIFFSIYSNRIKNFALCSSPFLIEI